MCGGEASSALTIAHECRKVLELEEALRKRHPNSIPALMSAAGPSEARVCACVCAWLCSSLMQCWAGCVGGAASCLDGRCDRA